MSAYSNACNVMYRAVTVQEVGHHISRRRRQRMHTLKQRPGLDNPHA